MAEKGFCFFNKAAQHASINLFFWLFSSRTCHNSLFIQHVIALLFFFFGADLKTTSKTQFIFWHQSNQHHSYVSLVKYLFIATDAVAQTIYFCHYLNGYRGKKKYEPSQQEELKKFLIIHNSSRILLALHEWANIGTHKKKILASVTARIVQCGYQWQTYCTLI